MSAHIHRRREGPAQGDAIITYRDSSNTVVSTSMIACYLGVRKAGLIRHSKNGGGNSKPPSRYHLLASPTVPPKSFLLLSCLRFSSKYSIPLLLLFNSSSRREYLFRSVSISSGACHLMRLREEVAYGDAVRIVGECVAEPELPSLTFAHKIRR